MRREKRIKRQIYVVEIGEYDDRTNSYDPFRPYIGEPALEDAKEVMRFEKEHGPRAKIRIRKYYRVEYKKIA